MNSHASKRIYAGGRLSGVLLGLVLVAAPCAQRTWIVDQNNGPGAQFTDMPPAVAAASAGDIVLVRSGSYTGPTITKGLILAADIGSSVTWHGNLTIRDLPANERCVVKRMHTDLVSPTNYGVFLDNNAGPVHMEFVALTIQAQQGWGIRNCAQVTLNDCSGSFAVIESSTVLMTFCSILAPTGLGPQSWAMLAQSSRVMIADSSVSGSAGTLDILQCFLGLLPGPAIAATNSDILVTGYSSGVAGGLVSGFAFCNINIRAPSVTGTGGSVTYDPTTNFGLIGPVQGTIQTVPKQIPGLMARSQLTTTPPVEVWLYGTPNASVWILASYPPITPPVWLGPAPGWPGFWLDFAAVVPFTGMMPASGFLQIQIPENQVLPPGYSNFPLAFQAALFSSKGLELSTPAVSVLN